MILHLQRRKKPAPGAFTVVELLVVLAILSSLCVLLVKLTGQTQGLVGSSVRRMDSDGQAQQSFARLSQDLAGVPDRIELPWSIPSDLEGPASMRFLSTVSSENGTRKLSAISYRIAPESASGSPVSCGFLSLQRASRGIDWGQWVMGNKADGTGVTFADLPDLQDVRDSDYDVLATGVIRLAVTCQLRGTGEIKAVVPLTTAGNPDLSRVAGLIVTLAVLDSRNLRLLTPAQVESIATVFPSPVDGVLPAAVWNGLANHAESFSGIPGITAQSIRVYQRYFPLSYSN